MAKHFASKEEVQWTMGMWGLPESHPLSCVLT